MTELDSKSFQQAIAGSEPAVVDFWAGWCMPCKVFAPVLEEISGELDGKASFYKLNVDDHGDVAQEYGITNIPTVIIFKDGAAVEKMVGVHPKAEVVETVKKYI